MPIFTLRIGIALALAAIFRWNKPATMLGIFLINPFTGPPYYALAYTVGHFLTGGQAEGPGQWDLKLLLNMIWNNGAFFLVLSLGCVVVAIPIALFLYWSVKATIKHWQNQ